MSNIWTENEEVEAVLAASRGDIQAFDKIARRYRGAAILVAKRHLSCPEMAEDAAQEGLLIAFKKLPALKDPTLFGAWLSSIIRNRCRRLSTDPSARNVSLDGFLLEQAPSIGNPPEMTLLFEEILRYVAGLPRDLSEIAHLYYFDHWNVGQIARFLSIPQTTVKWRLHECRKQLRRRFNTDEKN